MRVLLLGGDGFVGARLAAALDDRGHDVIALSRSPDRDALPSGVEARTGDVTDPDSLAAATRTAAPDAVVNLVALSPLFCPAGGSEAHDRVHRAGTENAVRAATEAGVDRFVQISALGADPDGATAYVRAKGRAEAIVRGSELDWTIVRPSVVFGDGGEFVPFTRLLTTPYVTALPGGGRTRFQPVHVGDLAALLADAVKDPAHAGETYELGGPDALTLADVARLVYAADGRSLRVLPVPMPLARLGLTLGGLVPGFPMGPDQYRSLRFDNTAADNDATAFGVDPADLLSFAAYLGVDEADAGVDERGGTDAPASDSGGSDAPDDSNGSNGPSPLTNRTALGLFAFLALTSALPAVVDIYSFVGLRLLLLPAYLVTLLVYDGGLESVVYAAERALGLAPSALRWEVGKLVTFYLVAVTVAALARPLRRSVDDR